MDAHRDDTGGFGIGDVTATLAIFGADAGQVVGSPVQRAAAVGALQPQHLVVVEAASCNGSAGLQPG